MKTRTVNEVEREATTFTGKEQVHVIVPISMTDKKVWVELVDKSDAPFDFHPTPFGNSAHVIVPRDWLGKMVRVKVI